MLAGDYNCRQSNNASDSYNSGHLYLQQQAAAQYPYYIFNQNQFNIFQTQQPHDPTGSYEQQGGLPHPHVPLRPISYTIPPPSPLAQNQYSYHPPQQQPHNPEYGHANNHHVPDKRFLNKSKRPNTFTFSIFDPKQTGPKKYPCKIDGCSMSYGRPADRICHIQYKHFDYAQTHNLLSGKFQCNQNGCPGRFKRAKTLDRHVRQYHPLAKQHYVDATATVSQKAAEGAEPPEPFVEDQDDEVKDQDDEVEDQDDETVAEGVEPPELLMNSQENDETDHGGKQQTHEQQPKTKYSLSFICGE